MRAINVYVENIPSHWSPIGMHRIMSKYGVVMDVFLPRKLSWNGVRHGFVRFKNNGYVLGIIKKHNAIVTEEGRPKANRARSMAEPRKEDRRKKDVGIPKVADEKGMLKACAFDILRSNTVTYDLCSRINSLIDSVVDVKALGSNHFLLAFDSREDMSTCLKSGLLSDSGIFEWLKPWEEGDCATNRLCCVNIYGAPPQACCEEVFSQVIIRFGSFIKLHNSLEDSNDLEVAKVLVSTTYKDSIQRSYKAKINNHVYDIRVIDVQPSSPFELRCSFGVNARNNRGGPGDAPQNGINGRSGGRRSEPVSDRDDNNSPDSFGIRDTIKNLGKGKQVMISEAVVDKRSKVQLSFGVLMDVEDDADIEARNSRVRRNADSSSPASFNSHEVASKIDRVFLDSESLSLFSSINLKAGSKRDSDHCPLILAQEAINWGARPFKFLSCWLLHPEFDEVLEEI
ncbi:hypothetical protein Tsubulata_019352, partial [Turnera subulata]